MKERRPQERIATAIALTLAILLTVSVGAIAQPPVSKMPIVQSHKVQAAGAWSSGWVSINQGQTLTLNHNLGGNPEHYAVELKLLDTAPGGLGINRRAYGGLEVSGQQSGAHWQNLTSTSIQVYRQPDDLAADRVHLWVAPAPTPPAFDSGWVAINPDQTISIAHNVGSPAEDLTVSLWFKGAARGIHHFAYGGMAMDVPETILGAHWQNLTSSTVEVHRQPDDTDVEQVRVIVVLPSPPAYDSLQEFGDWQGVAAGASLQFVHNLSWPPHMLLLRAECYDPTEVLGIHQLFAGGNHHWLTGFEGANLQNSTKDAVSLYRHADDEFCPQVRLRIWRRGLRVFLPVALME